jgi:hypothetical protein
MGTFTQMNTIDERMARRLNPLPRGEGKVMVFRARNVKLCSLEIASVLQADDRSLAAAAVEKYPDTKEERTPVQRAGDAFKSAFGRPAKTKTIPHEAEALADIVRLAGG